MTAKRFTVDSDGKYWDTVSKKYVTIDHLFYLVEKLEKENELLRTALKELKEIGDYQADRIQELNDENEQLKQVIEKFVENPTQHNLWKLRTILKDLKGDVE